MTAADRLADAAVQPIDSGMTVGLGTGRAATRAIRSLARRIAAERFKVTCVATSNASADLARSLGLSVADMRETPAIDYLFDGADAFDDRLRMIKGRGGAMTRERIAARAAARRVYLVQSDKHATDLALAAPLPIEVIPFALASVLRRLGARGLACTLRRTPEDAEYRTDNGNPVLDAELGAGADLEDLAGMLDTTAGVVDHGLFLDEADELLIEVPGAELIRLPRPGH